MIVAMTKCVLFYKSMKLDEIYSLYNQIVVFDEHCSITLLVGREGQTE